MTSREALSRFAAALISRVLTAYGRFVENDYRDKFATLWQRFDVLRGQTVTVTAGLSLGSDSHC